MVERERQDRKIARSSERKVRVLEQTTLAELGIETPNDKLNLAADKITLATARGPVAGTTINLVLNHHPLSGEHTAQYLNSAAPFGRFGRRGILDDLNMPINAKRAFAQGKTIEESEALFRHERHLQDPDVGSPYKSFIDQHLNSWLRNIQNGASLDVFDRLQRIRFVEDIENLRSKLSLEFKEKMSRQYGSDFTYRTSHFALRYYERAEQFMSLLNANITNFEELRARIHFKPRDDKHLMETVFSSLPLKKQFELLATFFNQFTEQEKKSFVLSDHLFWHKLVLADLSRRQILQREDYVRSAKVEFVDEERIKIGDDEGTAVEVVPDKDIGGGQFDWKATNYEFSPQYLSTALYSTIAWERNEDGQRRFLIQKEARPYLRQLGLPEARRGDVKLGEIMAVYFSPKTAENWKKQIPLKPLEEAIRFRGEDDFEQPMMGGQMGVWVTLKDHSQQLFSEENGLFDRLEQRMAVAA